MTYTKYLPTLLHNGYNFEPSGTVLIIKNNLVDSIIPQSEAGDDIKLIDGIICPGFVNTHCHLELSYLKNKIATNTGMVNFLLAVMQNRNTATEIIQNAITNAEAEMIVNGIVAVGDICNTANTIVQKQKNKLHYTNFIEISGFVPATAAQRFADGKTIQNQFLQKKLQATIVPHSPYSVSQELMQLINTNASNATTTMHYNESEAEKQFLTNGSGNFLQLYNTLGIDISFWQNKLPMYNKHIANILVHNVVTNLYDIEQYKNAWYCLCPNANIYIGNGLPNIELLMQHTNNICLGTDSFASNHQLSILEEIKTIQQHFSKIKLETLLQWATINGANALGIQDKFGSFEKGKSGKFVKIS